jgi:hypothetical protein
MDPWISLVWLVIVFLLMLALRRWVEAHVQGVAFLLTGHPALALWLFFFIFLPGTLVHELSHWLAAKLLVVPTGRIAIWPQSKGDGSVWLGAIEVARTDPLRSSLIGLAPLVSGSLLVAAIGAHLQLDALGSSLISGNWELIAQDLSRSTSLADFWIWLYLLFAIANRMLPSPADREPWKPLIIFLALIGLIVVAAGWTPQLSPDLRDAILNLVGFLLYAFALTAAIDLLVALLIGLLEGLAVLVLHRRVPY